MSIKDNFQRGDKFPDHQWNNAVAREINRAADARRTSGDIAGNNDVLTGQVTIKIKNCTGKFLPRLSVVSVCHPLGQDGRSDRIGNNNVIRNHVLNEGIIYDGLIPGDGDAWTSGVILSELHPKQIGTVVIMGIVPCLVDIRSMGHEFASIIPDNTKMLQSAESGDIRLIRQSIPRGAGLGQHVVDVLFSFGSAAPPPGEYAAVVEPIRRPLFRNIAPNPHADEHTPEGNAAKCMGTIQLPGKTYQPIRALDEEGQPLKDEEDNPLYVKRREPKTGSGRFVLRIEGKISEGIEWIYCDDTPYDEQGTTTEKDEAQYNYDHAICYNIDWSELLIEGDKVQYQQRTTTIEIDEQEVEFTYYEVTPIQAYTTPVEGQADVIVMEVEPHWTNPNRVGDPATWEWTEIESHTLNPPQAPNFEAVYLKLKGDRCTPELVKTVGIVNDCTALRVRGVFIRQDTKGRRYPMLFELAYLRAGGAVRTRDASCYYKTEEDECSPVGFQPNMQLVRVNDWRLSLSPNVCAIAGTALTDPFAKE